MAEQNAWVTLATNDSYCLGALVLAHSLRRVGTKYQIAILITPTVSEIMKARLATVFSQVTLVDVLDSKDAAHLSLLARPELGITFTKLHCWNLTQYKKCVFLDADTLVLQNSDELFEREEFSAAPDVGWPDCFNSGVFVFQPSKETFETLIKFAQEKGSFDGGDQGLLNQYFSDWARGDINKHLPFLYNVCSTAFYSYLPAFKQFGADTKIMHFIGSVKPWMQKFNWASRTVSEEGHLQAPSQTWWNIFLENVHPCLDAGMTGIAGALSQLTIGTSEQGSAVEEHLRRQGWETGNIDYMGADSFDNILAKISQTLSSPPEQPASDSSASNVSPTEVPSPVAAPAVFDLPLPEVAPGSKIVICPMQPKPAEVTPTEVAPVAPVVAAPETKTKIESVTQESQATTDEKQDSKQAETNTTDISMSTPCEVPPSKPFEKLVCHLKPTEGVDPLVTPENEHEEAASIAMRIIASEEALSSPIITSATPPISTPTHPAIPQNIKDLAIDTRIPETPPVPGPVSLAQIGILPLEQPSSLSDIAEKCELSTGKDEPLQDSPVAEPIVKEDATKPVETVPVSKDELSETPKTDETTPIVDDIKADPIVKEASIEEPPKSSETDVAPVAEVEAVPKVEEKIETPKPEEPATPVAVPEVVQKEEEKITPLEAEVLAATVAVVEAVKKEEDKIEAPKEAEPVAPVAEVEAAPKEESPKSPEPVATVAEVEATPKEESPKSPEPVATVAEVEATPKEESPKSPESVATVAEVEVVPKEAEKIEAPKAAESITPVAEVQAAPKEESPKSPEPVTAVVEAEIVSKKAEKIEAPTPAEPVVAVVEAAIAPKEAKEVEAPKAAEPATPVAEVQAALKEEQKVEPVAEITVKKVVVKTKAVESPKVETSAVAEPIPEVKAAPKKKVKKEKPELPKTSEPVTPVAEIELTLKKEEKTEPPKAETTTVKEPVIPAAEIKVAPKKDKKEKPELPKVEPAEPAVPAKDIKLELSTKKSDPLESPKAPTDLPADSAAPAVKTVKRVVKKPQPVPESEDSKKIEVSADKEKPSEKPLDKKDDASTKEVPAEAVPKPRKVIKKVVKTVPVAKSDSKDETVLKKKADAPPTPVSEPKDSPISEVVSKEKVSVESVTPKDDTKAAIKEADATVKPKKVFKKPPTLLAKSDVAEDTEAKKAEDMPVPPPRKKEKKVEKK